MRNGCETFVLISTDKAVNPTNVMGASKRLAEIYARTLNARRPARASSRCASATCSIPPAAWCRCSASRSRVAVPVTVTHPEVKRYFMTIPEASQLILQAAVSGSGGRCSCSTWASRSRSLPRASR
jgi:FlaA1/EpsC-like NDP-sugar epimerase